MANSVIVKEQTVKVGDVVKISYKYKEGDKEKVQLFQGMVISIKGKDINKTFTVRKVTKDKIGVERIFSVVSPFIEKIEIVKSSVTRRGKIYFVRGLSDRDLREKLS